MTIPLVPLLLAPALLIGMAIGGYAIIVFTDPKRVRGERKPDLVGERHA